MNPIVLVTWADTHSGGIGWTPITDIDQDEYIIKTCGFLLATCDGGKANHVTIYQSETEDGDLDHILHIPVAMVRGIKVCSPETHMEYGSKNT
jgi:hypothetical protein